MQPGQKVLILNPPPGYVASLGELPDGVALSEEPRAKFDFVHLFVEVRRCPTTPSWSTHTSQPPPVDILGNVHVVGHVLQRDYEPGRALILPGRG